MVLPWPTTAELPHPLPAPLVELIAERFRVLGEPMRIRLLDALREAPATVQELQRGDRCLPAERLQASRPAAAQRAGEPRKEGNFSRYAIADEGVFELCEQVCGGLRRQLDELDALLPGGADAMRPAACARRRDRSRRRRAIDAGRLSASCSRSPAA